EPGWIQRLVCGPYSRRKDRNSYRAYQLDQMEADVSQAFFGLMGVVVGALLALLRDVWSDRRTRKRHARYLAIRVVCILDKYIENCAEVVLDNGLQEGQRDEQGCLQSQVRPPAP